jgi:hypothetical protein
MTDDSLIARNMERSSCGPVDILSWYTPGRTEEIRSTVSARIPSSWQTHEPDTSALQAYCVTAALTCSIRLGIKNIYEVTRHSCIQTEIQIVTEIKVRATCKHTILLSIRLTNRLHSSHDSSWNGFPDWQKTATSVSKVQEALLI